MRVYKISFVQTTKTTVMEKLSGNGEVISKSLSTENSTISVKMHIDAVNKICIQEAVKRPANLSSEEDHGSLSKYRKLPSQGKNVKVTEDDESDISSPCNLTALNQDGTYDGSSDSNENGQGEQSPCVSQNREDSFNKENTEDTEQFYGKVTESESESMDLFEESPSVQISSSEIIEEVGRKQTDEAINMYFLASNASKVHNLIIHTNQHLIKQVSNANNEPPIVDNTDKDFEQNEMDVPATQPLPDDIDRKRMDQTQFPNTSVNDNVSMDKIISNGSIGNSEQREVFETVPSVPHPKRNKDLAIKTEKSIIMHSQLSSDIVDGENIGQTLDEQADSLQASKNMKKSESYPLEHFQQTQQYNTAQSLQAMPSTSGNFGEKNLAGTSRSDSVSDLNLIQLILSLKDDIYKLGQKVDKHGSILEAVMNGNLINIAPLFARSFPEKYALTIPFTKSEDFYKFNQDLTKNVGFSNECIQHLCTFIDNNVSLGKNILNMLRNYMSRELVMLFTASKATPNKMVLKDTMFCTCLLQATRMTLRNGLLPLEHEKAFTKNLGLVVSGARSWHTHHEGKRNNQGNVQMEP